MLPLATHVLPTTRSGWRDAIAGSVRRWIDSPPAVRVDGATAALDAVNVGLPGGNRDTAARPDGTTVGSTVVGPSVARLRIAAHPPGIAGLLVTLSVTAEDGALATGQNAAVEVVVSMESAARGRLLAHVAGPDPDRALLLAAGAGAPAGVDVRSVAAPPMPHGPRDLSLALDVTVKRFAAFAAGVVGPQLAELDGRRVPLATALGPVPVRDVAVDTLNGLQVTATLGGRP